MNVLKDEIINEIEKELIDGMKIMEKIKKHNNSCLSCFGDDNEFKYLKKLLKRNLNKLSLQYVEIKKNM